MRRMTDDRGMDGGARGHPSQAEGEDPDDAARGKDARTEGHPSQAEGDDDEDDPGVLDRYDVLTFPKSGQWANHVQGAREASRSYPSREEAIDAGRAFAREHGSRHIVHDAEPTGAITDGGAPQDPIATTGTRRGRADGLPETTDENGLPLDNPSG